MRRGIFFAAVLAGVIAFATAAAGSGTRGGHSSASLDLYTAVVTTAQLGQLGHDGYDVAQTRQAAGGVQVDLVLTKADVAKLAKQGIDVKPRLDKQGRTQVERAAEQAAAGFNVWRSYDQKTAFATSSTRSRAGTRRS